MDELMLEQWTFSYPDGEEVLRGVNLSIQAGTLVFLCGPSGGGKTTLLRCLKPELRPVGKVSGRIWWRDRLLDDYPAKDTAQGIAFLDADIDAGFVCDSVWHEIAFGLESLGIPSEEIRRRTAEMALFFGMEHLFDRSIHELSTGEKQMVSLAARLVLRPRLLLLDEPLTPLDPVQSQRLLELLQRIRREFATTILIAEHQSEDLFSCCDTVVSLQSGKVEGQGDPQTLIHSDFAQRYFDYLPSVTRLFQTLHWQETALNTEEGRRVLEKRLAESHPSPLLPDRSTDSTNKASKPINHRLFSAVIGRRSRPMQDVVWRAQDIEFRYDRDIVFTGVDLTLLSGEIVGLFGSNGAGKTTLLELMAGAYQPNLGRVKVTKGVKIALVPQDPTYLFACETVEDEWEEMRLVEDADWDALRDGLVEAMHLSAYRDRHPFDLSRGQRQRVALVKVLLTRPQMLLLDEPTTGLDPDDRLALSSCLKTLAKKGVSVLLASHDVEFCAEICDRALLLFGKRLLVDEPIPTFFQKNVFFTPQLRRVAGDWIPEAVNFSSFVDALQHVENAEDGSAL